MSHTSIVRRKQDHNKQTWEENDFPIVCEPCLGENPYVRMTKEPFGQECKTCSRPYTVFRWRPGPRARYKKTEVCQVCAKLKNICQGCLLDLQFGLPSHIRDQAMSSAVPMPESEVNREFYMDQASTMIAITQRERETTTPDQMLQLLTDKAARPIKKDDRLCSYYQLGQCTRGDVCQYRHVKAPEGSTPMNQDFVRANDARKKPSRPRLAAPADKTVTTLFVGGVKGSITEDKIREKFGSFGELKSVTVVPKLESAFVNFEHRQSAERAARSLFGRLKIDDVSLRLAWGRPANSVPSLPRGAGAPAPAPPAMLALGGPKTNTTAPPPSQFYPSMDPTAMGTKGDRRTKSKGDE